MSVLCCRVPDFLVHLTYRHDPGLSALPLALLGPDERVCAVSSQAHQAGVQIAMPAGQAKTHCPDLTLRPVDMAEAQAEQSAFQATLASWGLPVESLTWGAAYLDLHEVARSKSAVQPLAGELGRQVRHRLGQDQQPAIGWDSGKFTARAAALRSQPGRMRLVGKEDEVRFLSPLPITVLPLPHDALQQLHWLGIRTLGQFAGLPAVAVQQRFGAAGRQAQLWAQGKDARPVRPTVSAAPDPITIDLDPPTANLSLVLSTAMHALQPVLEEMSGRLEGCRRVRAELHFLDGETRIADMAVVEPISQPAGLQSLIAHHLRMTNWPNELLRLRLSILETGELAIQQLSLFAAQPAEKTSLAALAQELTIRYGPVFLRAEFSNPSHPISSRRFQLHAFV